MNSITSSRFVKHMDQEGLIYLDNNATTPVDPRVLELMLPYFSLNYANPSSSHHAGQKVNRLINETKESIAQLIGATSNEIIFTSGATEATNLALKGIIDNYSSKRKHFITVSTEHKAVLDTCKFLESRGIDVTYLTVNREGLIDIDELASCISDETILICVMHVNNETGVIQNIKKIGEIAKEHGIIMMTDASQSMGKLPFNVDELNVDIVAFSAHKFYGPKGTGGLYIRKGIKPMAQIHGGGHEKGFRSGTLNVPAIVGMGHALSIANAELISTIPTITRLRDDLEEQLLKIEGSYINGAKETRLYNVINIYIPQLEASIFIGRNKDVAVSNGSACTSFVIEPSHVLKAMGLNENEAFSSLRISFGKFNTFSDIEAMKQRIMRSL